MRSFAFAAIFTALVGLVLGAALAAADPDVARGGAVALAAGDSAGGGALGSVMRMVGKPFQGMLNLVTGTTPKTGAVIVEPKNTGGGSGRQDKPVGAGGGGGDGKR